MNYAIFLFKRVASYFGSVFLLLVLSSSSNYAVSKDIKHWNSFQELLDEAKGSQVTLYGWGGDEKVNHYFDSILAPTLKKKYNIELKRIPMLADAYLNKISTEIEAKVNGNADILWINGANFKIAKEQHLLYGPIPIELFDNSRYLNLQDQSLLSDYGTPVEQMELPFGRAQFILISRDNYQIKTPQDLFNYVKQNPGRFTYPNPNDFIGAAFLRNLIYALNIDVSQLASDKNKLRKQLSPLFNYLNQIKPYLWNKGGTYPANVAALDYQFSNSNVDFSMNYNPFHVYASVESGQYPKTTRSFMFETGSTADTHFMAIANNAPNIAGALVVLNEMISIEMQYQKYLPSNWGDLPVLDQTQFTAEQMSRFSSIDFGENSLSITELSKNALPELNADILAPLVELWSEEVLYK